MLQFNVSTICPLPQKITIESLTTSIKFQRQVAMANVIISCTRLIVSEIRKSYVSLVNAIVTTITINKFMGPEYTITRTFTALNKTRMHED